MVSNCSPGYSVCYIYYSYKCFENVAIIDSSMRDVIVSPRQVLHGSLHCPTQFHFRYSSWRAFKALVKVRALTFLREPISTLSQFVMALIFTSLSMLFLNIQSFSKASDQSIITFSHGGCYFFYTLSNIFFYTF